MLTVPDVQSSPTYDGQSMTDNTDLQILQVIGTGVLSGGACTSGGGMVVDIAAMVYGINYFKYSVSSKTVTIPTASSTDRRDVIIIDASGVPSVVTGTPCGASGWTRGSSLMGPVKPALSVGQVALQEVYVPGGASSLNAGNLIDKRVPLSIPNGADIGAYEQPVIVLDVVAQFGADPIGIVDAAPAVQSAVLAAKAMSSSAVKVIWIPEGVFKFDRVLQDGSVQWHVACSGDNIKIKGPGTINSTATTGAYSNLHTFLFNAAGRTATNAELGGTGAMDYPNWIVYNTQYNITPAASGSPTITLASPSDSANFSVGSWIFTRAGQTIPELIQDQPDSEINQIIAIDNTTGIITLRWATGKAYQEEWYINSSGANWTSTTPTANGSLQPTVSNITNKLGHGCSIDGLGTGTINAPGTQSWAFFMHYFESDANGLTGTFDGGMCYHQFCRTFTQTNMRGNRTGTSSVNTCIAAGAATGTTDGTIEHIRSTGNVQALHFHEGCNQIVCRDFNVAMSPATGGQGQGISIAGRSYSLTVKDGRMSGGNGNAQLTIDATCTAGGVVSNVDLVPTFESLPIAASVNGTGWALDVRYPPGSYYLVGGGNYSVTAANTVTIDSTGHIAGELLPQQLQQYFLPAAVFPGAAGSYFSTPSATANRITGDIELHAWIGEGTTLRPPSQESFGAKDGGAGSISYALALAATGIPVLYWTTDGTTVQEVNPGAALPAVLLADLFLKVTFQVNSGGQYVGKFYTSPDNATWTPLGSTTTGTTGPTSIFDSPTQPVEIGSLQNGVTQNFSGVLVAFEIYNAIGATSPVQRWQSPTIGSTTYTNPVTGEVWTTQGTAITYTFSNLSSSAMVPADIATLAAAKPKWIKQNVSANFTIAPFTFYEVTTGSSAIVATLPSNVAGTEFNVKKVDSGSGSITLSGTIDGTVNPAIAYQWGTIWAVGDGTSWNRPDRHTVGSLVDVAANGGKIPQTSLPSPYIGFAQYAPGTLSTKSVTGTTMTALDTTNLTVSFVAPSSGNVVVRLKGLIQTVTGGTYGWWGLFQHGTSTLVGVLESVAAGGILCNGVYEQKITGLTPGTTYQFDWAAACGTAGDVVNLFCGGQTTPGTTGQSPAVMSVTAA